MIVRAVGDIAINRDEPERAFERCEGILAECDLSIGQLESVFTVAPFAEGRADAPLRSAPRNAVALHRLGIRALSLCGNHVMSCGPAGLGETAATLAALGIETFGAGDSLAAARQPLSVAAAGQRLSVVAANCILPPGCAATAGTAGCRPLRIATRYEMIEPNQPGTPARIITQADSRDLADLAEQVTGLRLRGDRVIVWLHWGLHLQPETIADYQVDVAHGLIDAGAELIVGTHPHLLKGVEIYRGRTILHSIGNFVFDLDVDALPARRAYHLKLVDLYPGNPVDPPADNRLYPFAEESRMTVMVEAAFHAGKAPLIGLHPAYIGSNGQPRLLAAGEPQFDAVAS